MKLRVIALVTAVLSALIVAPAEASTLKIGIAYDIGGRGDRSFNDAAALGLEKAQKQFTFTVESVVTDGTTADRELRVRALITKGCNPIVVVGSGYAPTIQALAVEFPNSQFAILNDATIDALNVTSLVFADVQGAFLAGFSAALASKTGKVAMIANANQADIYKNGFLAGVLTSKKRVTSMVKYISGSTVTAAKQAMDAGADVLFIARPGSNSEVFSAIVARNAAKAKLKNTKPVGMISVAPDQYLSVTNASQKYLYATVVKKVDKAMYDVIAKAISGELYLDVLDPNAGIYGHRYSISDGGVSFKTYLSLLSQSSASINAAALQASKISR